MEKDKTIIALISMVRQHPDLSSLEVVDYWDADLCAIGFKKGDRLVYINTYNYTGASAIRYDLDLELIKDKEGYTVVKSLSGVLEGELLDEMKVFLG